MRLPDKFKYLLKGTPFYKNSIAVIDHTMDYLSNLKFVKTVLQHGSEYEIQFYNGNTLNIRGLKSSDFEVFKQIFVTEEYSTVCSILQLNQTKRGHIIIDAGANVGFTTLYLNDELNLERAFLIEPDPANFSRCKLNIEKNFSQESYILMNKALAAEEGQKFDLSRNFRDGLDWSVVTEENPSGQTSSITIDSIISEYSLKHISLLKIDIEGYERFVFDKAKNLDFLKMVFVIAIEIHDEFKSRQVIEGQLIAHGFTLFNSGELTVGINKNHVLNA